MEDKKYIELLKLEIDSLKEDLSDREAQLLKVVEGKTELKFRIISGELVYKANRTQIVYKSKDDFIVFVDNSHVKNVLAAEIHLETVQPPTIEMTIWAD